MGIKNINNCNSFTQHLLICIPVKAINCYIQGVECSCDNNVYLAEDCAIKVFCGWICVCLCFPYYSCFCLLVVLLCEYVDFFSLISVFYYSLLSVASLAQHSLILFSSVSAVLQVPFSVFSLDLHPFFSLWSKFNRPQ